jgi:hypothetical protein
MTRIVPPDIPVGRIHKLEKELKSRNDTDECGSKIVMAETTFGAANHNWRTERPNVFL